MLAMACPEASKLKKKSAILTCHWCPGCALISQTLPLNEKVHPGVESNLGHRETFIAGSSDH